MTQSFKWEKNTNGLEKSFYFASLITKSKKNIWVRSYSQREDIYVFSLILIPQTPQQLGPFK